MVRVAAKNDQCLPYAHCALGLLTNCSQSPVPKALLLSALFRQDRGTRVGSLASHRPARGALLPHARAPAVFLFLIFLFVRQSVVLRSPVGMRHAFPPLLPCDRILRGGRGGGSGGDLLGRVDVGAGPVGGYYFSSCALLFHHSPLCIIYTAVSRASRASLSIPARWPL